MRESELSFVTNSVDRDAWFLWDFLIDRAVRLEWRAFTQEEWITSVVNSPALLADFCKDPYTSTTKSKSTQLYGELDDANYVHIRWYGESVSVTIVQPTANKEAATQWIDELKKILPVAVPKDDMTIPVRFWIHGANGAISRQRMISVPVWDDIMGNYAEETAEKLAGFMNGFKPSHGGQLVLWHGRPGTGKTFAIRALGQHWKDWCDIECVVDPESFFGSADYMMQVLMDTNAANSGSESSKEPWRLLILEDAGELLAEDARSRTGQGLSRMLNLADGLIGQGLQILMLVTTNEPLRSIHPAVSRPGRCAAEVEFLELSIEETKVWLEAHEQKDCGESLTLADLYGRMSDFKGAKKRSNPVGFRA